MHLLPADVAVISPHLDDAVLSLGASIARSVRSGQRGIAVVTVFAGDPDSRRPAGGWDRRGGFATEGEAATARRREDRNACRLVGAEAFWLPFSEADYRETLDGDAVWSALSDAIEPAGSVLVPGFPLTNPDHAWLLELFVRRADPGLRIGLYAEQPYRYTARKECPRPQVPDHLSRTPRESSDWIELGARPRGVWTKRRAVLAYRSQMPLLGFSQRRSRKLNGMLVHEALHGGEAIVWLRGP